MHTTLRLILVGLATLGGLALATAQGTAPDKEADEPIVGKWEMIKTQGESYKYTIEARADGTAITRMFDLEPMEGKWEKIGENKYRVEPCAADDYVIVKGDRLEEHDRDGFIRAFRRKE